MVWRPNDTNLELLKYKNDHFMTQSSGYQSFYKSVPVPKIKLKKVLYSLKFILAITFPFSKKIILSKNKKI